MCREGRQVAFFLCVERGELQTPASQTGGCFWQAAAIVSRHFSVNAANVWS